MQVHLLLDREELEERIVLGVRGVGKPVQRANPYGRAVSEGGHHQHHD